MTNQFLQGSKGRNSYSKHELWFWAQLFKANDVVS